MPQTAGSGNAGRWNKYVANLYEYGRNLIGIEEIPVTPPSHQEALKAILAQFDSYKSNCTACQAYYDNDVDLIGVPDICEDCNLICREKLLEAARECDA